MERLPFQPGPLYFRWDARSSFLQLYSITEKLRFSISSEIASRQRFNFVQGLRLPIPHAPLTNEPLYGCIATRLRLGHTLLCKHLFLNTSKFEFAVSWLALLQYALKALKQLPPCVW